MEEEQTLYYHIDGVGFCRVYQVNGEPVPHVILESAISKQYSGYRMIAKDLDLVEQGIKWLKANELSKIDIIAQSVTTFVVITYGKCFCEADSRNFKLDKGAFKYCTQAQKDLHKELMDIRHNYIAHAGETVFERNPVLLAKVPLDNDEFGFKVFDNLVYMASINVEVNLYDELVRNLRQYVTEKVSKSYTALGNSILDEINWEEFDKHSFTPDIKHMINLEEIRIRNKKITKK